MLLEKGEYRLLLGFWLELLGGNLFGRLREDSSVAWGLIQINFRVP